MTQFLATRMRSAIAAADSAAEALRGVGDFQLVLAVRDARGDLDYGVIDVRAGVVSSRGADAINARAPYALLQLTSMQVAAMLAGGSVEPELAFETAPLLAMIARALSASSGVSPWQTRL
ncbi:MAG: hypothetical protein IT383_07725 [Deltaproteobacteria bacterium]|nr:hypothetical protein [Deltaproteobacteria bacterium]